MHADMVYEYPIWIIGCLIVGLSIAGAVIVELVARRLIPIAARRQHNDVAAAMFGVIGVTFAVLLAFVAMLTFEGFAAARTAAASEAMVVRDVADAASGLAEPARTAADLAIIGYARGVIGQEWPAQAAGHLDETAEQPLGRLDALATAYRPSGLSETTYLAAFVASLSRLQDARAVRQLAAGSTVPTIVWIVMLLGGGLTVASGSFLGAPSLRMHLLMSATLAASGALVVVLIVALSNPFRGDFRVSTEALQRVLAHIEAAAVP